MPTSSARGARTLLPAALLLTACSFSGSVTAAQSHRSGAAGSTVTSSPGASAGPTTSSAGSATSRSSSAAAGSTGTTPPAGSSVPATSRCHTGELTGSLVAGSPGAGQRYATLVLRNAGRRTCTVHGYGGLGLAGSGGRALPTSQVRAGGPAATVTLAPGVSVSSALHWSAVPGPGDASTGPCQPDPATLRVIPPDETTSLPVAWTMGPVCSAGTIEQRPYAR